MHSRVHLHSLSKSRIAKVIAPDILLLFVAPESPRATGVSASGVENSILRLLTLHSAGSRVRSELFIFRGPILQRNRPLRPSFFSFDRAVRFFVHARSTMTANEGATCFWKFDELHSSMRAIKYLVPIITDRLTFGIIHTSNEA